MLGVLELQGCLFRLLLSPTSLLLSYVRMLFSLVRTWVSSNDVPTGKPAPDMYLEAAQN